MPCFSVVLFKRRKRRKDIELNSLAKALSSHCSTLAEFDVLVAGATRLCMRAHM